MDLISFINTWTVAITSIVGGTMTVIGAFYYWTKTAKNNRNEEDKQETKIKTLLGEQIVLQDQKITNLQTQINDSSSEIRTLRSNQKALETENTNYLKIFQGRDDDTVMYKREGREAMATLRENAKVSQQILEHMGKNDQKFNDILQEIQKIYEVLAEKYLENKKQQEKDATVN